MANLVPSIVTRFRKGFSSLMLLLVLASGARATAADPQPQFLWSTGPARVDLRLPGVSMDLPADLVYITDKPQLTEIGRVLGDHTIPDALAVVSPRNADWAIVVFADPAGLAEDNGENLVSEQWKEVWLKRFQAIAYRESEQLKAAGMPTYRITSFIGEPSYVGGARRSVYLPLQTLDSEGRTGARLQSWVTDDRTCVLLSAVVGEADIPAVGSCLKRLAEAVNLPAAPTPAGSSPPAAAPPAASPTPRTTSDNRTNEAMDKLMVLAFAVSAGIVTAIFKGIRSLLGRDRDPIVAESPQDDPRLPPPPPPEGQFFDA